MARQSVLILLILSATTVGPTAAQQTSFTWNVPPASGPSDPYSDVFTGGQFSGSHSVSGPFDLDGDGRLEVLVSDFSGGQRIHVFEVAGDDQWEWVYSTPFANDNVGSFIVGARHATGGDLDGDGFGEIIFVSGDEWDPPHPASDQPSLFIYEHTGLDNDFGSEAAVVFGRSSFVAEAGEAEPPYIKSDNFSVVDVDGDGVQELLFPNDASGGVDDWFILSVDGDIGSGFEFLQVELRLASRNAEYDPVNRGSGSTYAVNAADLDGDGSLELSFHSWNSFNFSNGDVAGPDTYVVPDETSENVFIQLTGTVDDLSWFNGVVVDINGDGDDEIFYPREYGFETDPDVYEYVTVMNYEDGEDVLQVTTDQVVLDAVGPLTAYGIDSGDLDGDGTPELIGAGRGFDGSDLTAGRSPRYLRVARWIGGVGGDPEVGSNYEITEVEFDLTPFDTLFNVIYRDSLGTTSKYYESAGGAGAYPPGRSEEISPTSISFLGDADGDGLPEVAVGFYGLNDTLEVIDETWNEGTLSYNRTVRERVAAASRPVFRIFELDEFSNVAAEANIVMPSDYRLSANYPNPFNPATTFEFVLPVAKTVSLRIYDVSGRVVRTLIESTGYEAGTHTIAWDGRSNDGLPAASGTYVYSLEMGATRVSRTMTLVK